MNGIKYYLGSGPSVFDIELATSANSTYHDLDLLLASGFNFIQVSLEH